MEPQVVAFLDVLGFKAVVEGKDHERLVGLYRQLVAGVQAGAAGNELMLVGEGAGRRVVPNLARSRVNVTVISDSILITGGGATAADVINVVKAVRRMLVFGFAVGLPLRGGIVLGHVAPMESSLASEHGGSFNVAGLVGRGLTEAYLLEGAQEWSGCVVDDAVVSHYEGLEADGRVDVEFASLVRLNVLTMHTIPWKAGSTRSPRGWTVNWPWAQPTKPTEEMVRHAFSLHGRDTSEAATKIENTVGYLHAVRTGE